MGERELDVLCDPQTSGLLITVPATKEAKLLQTLTARGVPVAPPRHAGPAGQITVLP